jgi:phosphohistidine phosphatase
VDLLVIRHAIAGDRDEWAQAGKPDHDRPVTDDGRDRMRENARGLRSVFPKLELIATSPLKRAVQTAAIVAEAYDDPKVVEIKALSPGTHPEDAVRWLAEHREAHIAVVGHEPSLGILVGWLLREAAESFVSLKKGGACLLRLPSTPAPGTADLKWLLPPKVLRRLGDA